MSFSPDQDVEAAKAWSVIYESDQGSGFQIFFCVFLSRSQRLKIYESEVFPLEKTPEKLAVLEAFAADMGFQMEDLRFSAAEASDQADMLRLCPLFHPQVEDYLSALHPEERESLSENFETTAFRRQSIEKYSYFLQQYLTLLSML